jgi:hypothetical protein
MKGLVAGIIGLSLFFILVAQSQKNNGKLVIPGRGEREMFRMEALQNTLNLIQSKIKNVYPIDTVYFNDETNGAYTGRFIFLNTDTFAGVQYDVTTDGKTIQSLSESVPPDYQNPFGGYSKYMDFKTITPVAAPSLDMSKIWENFRVQV